MTSAPFEKKALRERHYLLASALWLLDEWPHRFTTICKESRLTASRILSGNLLPYWLERPVREQLAAGTYVSTDEEAQNVAAYLQRNNKRITSKAVDELLGKTDAKASKLYSSFRPALTAEERDKLISEISLTVDAHPITPVSRARFKRDIVILSLLGLTKMGISELLQCQAQNYARILDRVHNQNDIDEVKRLIEGYLNETRPILANKNDDSEHLFLGVTGVALNYKNWGQYLTKMKRTHLRS